MIKLFIDSDILIDLLAKRGDYADAALLFHKISQKSLLAFTSPIVFANVHYIISKYEGRAKSIALLRTLRTMLSILPVTEDVVDKALAEPNRDFEDTIQSIVSRQYFMDFIISRNKKDFKNSTIPVVHAGEFLRI